MLGCICELLQSVGWRNSPLAEKVFPHSDRQFHCCHEAPLAVMWRRISCNRSARRVPSFPSEATVLQDESQRCFQNHKVRISRCRRFTNTHGVPVEKTLLKGCRTQIGQPLLGQYRRMGIAENKNFPSK